MKFSIKKITANVLIFALMLTMLTGCSGTSGGNATGSDGLRQVYTEEYASETIALKVGDTNITLAECIIDLIIQASAYGLTTENADTQGDNIKSYALSDIRTTTIISEIAKENGCTATPGDIELIEQFTDSYMDTYKDLLPLYGITRDEVYDAYYKQVLYQKYENDERNKLGQEFTVKNTEELEDYTFIEMYQITFPIIETDDSGNPVTNSDGGYNTMTDAEIAEVMLTAEQAYKDLASSGDPEAVAEKYGVKNISQTINGYLGGYSDEMNRQLEHLENGKSTTPIRQKLGIMIYYMKDNNDTLSKKFYIDYKTSDDVEAAFSDLETSWLTSVEISDEKDLIGTVWKDIDASQLALNMEKAGD